MRTSIGKSAYPLLGSLNNYSCIGFNSGGVVNVSNRIEVGNTSVTYIGGQVGFASFSDGRIKENVKENVPGMNFINKLRPVTYHFNIHKQNEMVYKGRKEEGDWKEKYDIEKITMTGFIAQEVEQAAKSENYDFSGVVVPENKSELYSLRYSEFVVPIVKGMQEMDVTMSAIRTDMKKLESTKQQNKTRNNKATEY